jgi:phosphomevalonate decarboxylase
MGRRIVIAFLALGLNHPGVPDLKATATAHPIQGLIKYHGLIDPELRIPYHDSISVCTAPTQTRTTVAFGKSLKNKILINGKPCDDRTRSRVEVVIAKARKLSGVRLSYSMASHNNFPSNIGLGASASGFAALATALDGALELGLNTKDLSRLARLGAGSAARSVAGGFSYWVAGSSDETSYAYPLADESFKMGMVAAVVPAFKVTDDMHADVVTSPFFHSRMAYLHRALAEMQAAIAARDIPKIGEIAERDTLVLHGITMTGRAERILWRPETLKVILEVQKMREEGEQAWFSIDTGATPYVNCRPKDVGRVERRVKELGLETLPMTVAGRSKCGAPHLF